MKKQILDKKYIQLATLVIFLVLDVCIWSATFRADNVGELTVAFLDVGQGDAIYIEAPNGNQVLIDGGQSGGAVLRVLGKIMPFYDHSLDIVFATHPDQDHIGGLSSVLNRMRISSVATTENTSDTGAYSLFEKTITEKQNHRILARAGEKIILDDGIVLEILFPDRSTAGWETNTSSIVARLSYGEKSFLFTGDSPELVEKYIISEKGGAVHSDVLKLAHHGSRTSSSREFLSAVNPEYAVISAGKNNKYGHPHKEVTDLLSELKIKSFNTADSGTIVFKTDGEELRVE